MRVTSVSHREFLIGNSRIGPGRPGRSSTTEILSAFDESVPRARKVLTGLDFGRTYLLFVQNSKDCYIRYPQMPGAYVKSIAGA